MCQKIINGIAIFSGVISLTVVGTAGYVYVQKDAIIESVKEKALGSIGGGALGGVMKSLPADQAPQDLPVPLPSPGLSIPSAPIGF